MTRFSCCISHTSLKTGHWFGPDRFWKSKWSHGAWCELKASWKLRELWRDMNDMKVLSCIVYVHGMSITYATRPSILELGSGTGAAGLAFAATGAKAVQPEFPPKGGRQKKSCVFEWSRDVNGSMDTSLIFRPSMADGIGGKAWKSIPLPIVCSVGCFRPRIGMVAVKGPLFCVSKHPCF